MARDSYYNELYEMYEKEIERNKVLRENYDNLKLEYDSLKYELSYLKQGFKK